MLRVLVDIHMDWSIHQTLKNFKAIELYVELLVDQRTLKTCCSNCCCFLIISKHAVHLHHSDYYQKQNGVKLFLNEHSSSWYLPKVCKSSFCFNFIYYISLVTPDRTERGICLSNWQKTHTLNKIINLRHFYVQWRHRRKSNKTSVLPGFSKIEHGGGSSSTPDYYGGLT